MILKTISILVFGFFLNVIPPHQQKPTNLTATGPINQWQNLIEVVAKSHAEYPKVIAAQEFLLTQLNDTTLQKKINEKLK